MSPNSRPPRVLAVSLSIRPTTLNRPRGTRLRVGLVVETTVNMLVTAMNEIRGLLHLCGTVTSLRLSWANRLTLDYGNPCRPLCPVVRRWVMPVSLRVVPTVRVLPCKIRVGNNRGVTLRLSRMTVLVRSDTSVVFRSYVTFR